MDDDVATMTLLDRLNDGGEVFLTHTTVSGQAVLRVAVGARGEVLVLNDNFCVRVAELIVGESACA